MKTLLALLLLLAPASAVAQVLPASIARGGFHPEGQDMTPAVVLARVCVKEAGFERVRDCAAIRVVLDRVGRGDVVLGARLYSRRVFDPKGLGRRPWIAYLNGQGDQPAHWPSTMRWNNFKQSWLTLVDLCGQWIDAQYKPCNAHHWGDREADHDRAVSFGWQLIDCGTEDGPTANEFWCNPRLGPCDEPATVSNVDISARR